MEDQFATSLVWRKIYYQCSSVNSEWHHITEDAEMSPVRLRIIV
jgi:hypothetical protein